ncbi:DnaA ATPase domain-containing protein [Sphingomonas colocasiae]|uniref:Chromosomal replication initiator DnaA n=1 Tax=Sphingomonas colocasiae TaxID=1848973 RepID=A0ABS7PJ54_9SPHN|nr:chromosomal replication initiator DnaA [Sphingomonas colocasiae]
MSQIALPLDWPADETDADFLVSASNAAAVRHLEHVGTWPVWATVLTGPRKSGRSLLGRIFALKSKGTLIDNAEEQSEERIFHAWNAAQEIRKPLLIVTDRTPGDWRPRLADLRSRLAATPIIRLEDPDDGLIDMLIEKQLGTRGIVTTPEFRAFVVARIERSFIAVLRFVDLIDQAALARRRRINITLARQVLAEMGVIDESHSSG